MFWDSFGFWVDDRQTWMTGKPEVNWRLHVLTEGRFTIFTTPPFSGCALFGSLVWFVSPEAQVLLSSAARGQNCAGRSVEASRGLSIPPSPPDLWNQ